MYSVISVDTANFITYSHPLNAMRIHSIVPGNIPFNVVPQAVDFKMAYTLLSEIAEAKQVKYFNTFVELPPTKIWLFKQVFLPLINLIRVHNYVTHSAGFF